MTSRLRLRVFATMYADPVRDLQIFTPILHWIEGKSGPAPKPVPYPYGSRGPKELESFIGKYGYKRTEPN